MKRNPELLSRRTFLRSAVGATAVAGWMAAARAATPATLDLGFSLYGMKALPVVDALRECAAIGYGNVELCYMPGYPTEPAAFANADRRALREQLAARGMTVSGGLFEIHLTATPEVAARHADMIKAASQVAHDVQPAAPPLLETVLGGKPPEWEATKERLRDRLATWAAAAKSADIVIAIKAHVGSVVNSPERLLWLLQAVPSPHLCAAYDYSHFSLHGLSLADSLTPLLPHTKFIHVKDAAGEPAKPRFLLPGEGTIDYVAYFRALERASWRGPIVVEVSSQIFRQPGYDAVAAARKSFAALSAAAQRARG